MSGLRAELLPIPAVSDRDSIARTVRDGLGPFVPALGILAGQLVLFPMSIGNWSLGVITGLLTALLALGMALIYRSNRVLNFAQGDMGTVPTTLVIGLVTVSGLPYLLGLSIGFVSAVVLGAVIEVFIVRRFTRSPRLLLTVATIGISQLLVVSGLLLPRLWHKDIFSKERIPDPFNFGITIGSQHLGGSEILAAVLAPAVLLALAAFLQFSDLGIAVRASSDRTDRAALLGIPVRRIQTFVWMVASTLSFLGVFLHASIFGGGGTAALSAQVLVFALGAMILGRLEHLPAIAFSAVVLRLLGRGVEVNNPDAPGRIYVVLAAVLLIALALQRKAGNWRRSSGVEAWRVAAEVRPIPTEILGLTRVRLTRVLLAVVAIAAAAGLPLVLGAGDELKAATVAAFALITLSVTVLTGWAGQVSLGQMSFVAVGAAVGAVATSTWNLDLSLALMIAGLAGAATAMIVGLPALRLPGIYLAITTLAFALASSNYLLNRKEQSWIPRERIERPAFLGVFDLTSQAAMYEFVLAVVLLGFLAVLGIRRSRTGRVLLAVRDNESAASAYSISVLRAKLTGFALSGFLASVAGCLLVHINQAYSEQPFVAAQSMAVFTAAVVGGLGSLSGALFGSLYLNGGTWFLPERWQL
ncbi:MAG TPA: hypothetical protein VL068_03525, partial [Microthrixaceae bacterium]|nr:hypothetical protein [Microthrixaceae bacterium]